MEIVIVQDSKGIWVATFGEYAPFDKYGEGKTPQEALANLLEVTPS